MTSPPPEIIEFDWLGARVELRCDCPEVSEMVRRLWGTTPVSTPGRGNYTYSIALDGPGRPVFSGPEGERPVDRRQPSLHAYNLFVEDMLGRVDGHLVFHGTSVCRDGRAVVISGPSTFGKTTLGLHLALRGFPLLADDLTIIDRESSQILPFTRPFRLRPGTRKTLTALELERARAASRGEIDGEWAVDPVRWPGVCEDPGLPSVVILVRPHADGTGVRRFPFHEVRSLEGHEQVLDTLPRVEGVEEMTVNPQDPAHVRVRVSSSAGFARWAEEHRERLVFAVKYASERPDFTGDPRLEPLGTFQAALELCQEMLNRHPGSALAGEFGGQEARLVTETAAKLSGARCYGLFPGGLEDTLQLITERFEEAG